MIKIPRYAKEETRSSISVFRKLTAEFGRRSFLSPHRDSLVIINNSLGDFLESFIERPYPEILGHLNEILERLHLLLDHMSRSEAPPCMYALVEDMLEKYKVHPPYLVLKGLGYAMLPYSYWLSQILQKVPHGLDKLSDKLRMKESRFYLFYVSVGSLDYPIRWPSLYHEVSHAIDYLNEFTEKRYPRESIAKNYYRESFADLLAAHFFPYFGNALYDLLRHSRWDPKGPHPPHHERIKLIGEELCRLGFKQMGEQLLEATPELEREFFPNGCPYVIPPEVKEMARRDVEGIPSPNMPEDKEIEETLTDLVNKIPCPKTEPRALMGAIIKQGDPKKHREVIENSLDMYLLEVLKL